MKVLGIDPGTGRVGWAVIQKVLGKERVLSYGCFETAANTDPLVRLEKIYDFILELCSEFKPDEAAVESLFFANNAKTVMGVSQARGVILLALKKSGVKSNTYSPLQIKMGVTGYGKADKKQVQEMVKEILKLKEIPKPDDAADAVAVAITHLSTV